MPFFTAGELRTAEPFNEELNAAIEAILAETQENGHGILQLAIELKLIAEHLGVNDNGE